MPTTASPQRTIFAVGAVVLAAVAWFIVLKPRGAVTGLYFYDLGASKLYVESVKTVAPVKLPSGSEGVLAVVLACKSCGDESDRYIGYLEKNTDAYNQVIASGEPPTPQQMQDKSLIRALDGDMWLPAGDPAAQSIMNAALNRCAPDRPEYCTP